MPSLTIRNLEPETKEELRRQATLHGKSMQDEARRILRDALGGDPLPAGANFYAYVRSLVEPLGGIDDLALPPRDIAREPPCFD